MFDKRNTNIAKIYTTCQLPFIPHPLLCLQYHVQSILLLMHENSGLILSLKYMTDHHPHQIREGRNKMQRLVQQSFDFAGFKTFSLINKTLSSSNISSPFALMKRKASPRRNVYTTYVVCLFNITRKK